MRFVARNGRLQRALTVGLPPAVFFVVLLVAWQLAVTNGLISELLVPTPEAIATAFWELWTGGDIWPDLWATLYEAIAGFLLGSAVGIMLAVLCAFSTVLRRMLYPYAVALQITPSIALAPVLIAWLGFGYTSKIVLGGIIVFFPVFINAFTGMTAVDRNAVEMFRSMGASRRQAFLHLRLPSSLPVTFAGLKVGITLALIGAIVGEFISASKGLGLRLQVLTSQVDMPAALAVLMSLTLIGFVMYAVVQLLDRALVFWGHDGRLTAKTRHKAARATRRAAGATRNDVVRTGA